MSALPDMIVSAANATIADYEMLPEDSPVVVMVSGGGDSVALLRVLVDGQLVPGDLLQVLHIDHGLRGHESAEDAAFVRELCDRLGVGCMVVGVDVAAIAEAEQLNVEEVGRTQRYRIAGELLDALCDEIGVARDLGRIAVAHTRDDRVETTLMRLAQGAGVPGLTSLRPVRGRVVRPLLGLTREGVRDYLREIGQAWREDETNSDTTRLRAKVRHEIVPRFREINPRFDETLERTLALLTDEDDLLAEMGTAFARDFVERGEAEVSFDRAMMTTLSPPMRRRTVRAALLGVFPETSRLEFEHVEMLVSGLDRETFAHDLPGGLRAHGEYGRMVVSRTGEGPAAVAPCLLPLPGICDLGPAGRLVAEEVSIADVTGTPDSVVVDVGEGVAVFGVDRPREGDRMRPLGLDGTKKLSDLLIDEKVPRRFRGSVPVVRDGDDIVWVAGVRMSEQYKVTDSTSRAVRLTWDRGDEADRDLGEE